MSGNKFYIYSVSEDKDVSLLGGSVVLALRLSGIVGPSANWGATNYSHSVEIYRWGTMNLLKNYSGTGPQTAVGEITDVSWETHNGYPKSDIV